MKFAYRFGQCVHIMFSILHHIQHSMAWAFMVVFNLYAVGAIVGHLPRE